jgi:ArsR family transcriptional regulator
MRLTDILKALADDTRLDIVLFLMAGKKNAGQIVSKIGKSQPNISLALKQLSIVGIIDQEKKGREVYYKIRKPEQVRNVLELLEDLRR